MTRNLGGQTGGFFGGFAKFCRDNHPFIWKFYGNGLDRGAAQVAKDNGVFTVGREVRGDQFDPSEDIPAAVARANRYADLVLSRAVQFGALIDAWEFYNEPVINISHPDGRPDMPASIRAAQSLNAAQVQFSSRLRVQGFKVVAYNLARGNPFYELFPLLADGLIASDYCGLHAYGSPLYETDATNQSLRYRTLYASIPPAARKPIIFTEHGTDFNGGGFRLPANNLTTQQFFASMDWWLHQTAADDYVFGSCAFVVGADSARWETFEIAEDDSLPLFAGLVQKDIHVAPNPPLPNPEPPIGDTMQVFQPYSFPKRLSDVAWQGIEGKPTPDQPFYRIQPSAGLLTGVSAFAQISVIDLHGNPIAGAKVINDFGDGHGEVQQTDASGVVQFNFGPSSAFTPPALPPLTFFVADESAYKDDDRIIHYKFKLSDIVRGGDTNGAHTEGSMVMVAQVVMPDATSRDDAIRLRAYPSKALTIPVYCKDCALQAQGRRRNLGAVLSDEFYVTFAGEQYVAQGFALGVLATIVGHYADLDFFTVQW